MKHTKSNSRPGREIVVLGFLFLLLAIIVVRLGFWQIIRGTNLKQIAKQQLQKTLMLDGQRGKIFSSDDHLLVGNNQLYHLALEKNQLEKSSQELIEGLLPILVENLPSFTEASSSADKQEILDSHQRYLEERLAKDSNWIQIQSGISQQTKKVLEDLEIKGLRFEPYYSRYYPEASMAAHLLGFVGKNEQGEDIGYFGVEGALNQEISKQSIKSFFSADALGRAIFGSEQPVSIDGRDIVLTIRRDIQFAVEQSLKDGMEQYGASRGEVLVLDPKTGQVMAAAAYPNYSQETYYKFDSSTHKNPSLVDLYEPGSTFKVLTVAAGIDSGAITPETKCTRCDGPRVIGKYTIKTWNDEYHPDISMTEALAKSDNVAMIFAAEKIGPDKFVDYIQRFGIGQALNIDLQGDQNTPFPSKWGPVELATISFGQGISTNTFQMVRAVSAIANQGKMMRPTIIKKVIDKQTNQEIEIEPIIEDQVISKETARTVTNMMIESALHGEAQWIASKTYQVAGKTGTSQIAEGGEYQSDKTIASFIGFAPAHDPKFIMIVKLVEPQSSPWAAETAAPLWYKIADKLFLLTGVSPTVINEN